MLGRADFHAASPIRLHMRLVEPILGFPRIADAFGQPQNAPTIELTPVCRVGTRIRATRSSAL